MTTRTRKRGDLEMGIAGKFHYSSPWIVVPDHAFDGHNFKGNFYSEMVDVKSGVRRVKPVSQNAWRFDSFGLRSWINKDGASISPNKDCTFRPWPPEILSLLSHGVGDHTFSDFAKECFEAFYQQMPTEVSIPNFLFELREVKDLIPKLQSTLLKTTAGGYLNYQFGWKPLLDDLDKLRNIHTSVMLRLQYLRDTYGKVTRVGHGAERLFDMTYPTNSTTISHVRHQAGSHPSEWWYENWKLVEYRGMLRAGGYLYHKLEGLDDAWAFTKSMGAALGFNKPVSVIWQALPFSFVADWFFQFGSLLETLAVQPFQGTWQISHSSHSLKEQFVWDVFQHYSPNMGNNFHLVGRVRFNRYHRGVGLPVPSVFYTDGALNPKQQLLALALLLAK